MAKYINSRKKSFDEKFFNEILNIYFININLENLSNHKNLGEILFAIIISDILYNFSLKNKLVKIIKKRSLRNAIFSYMSVYKISKIKNLLNYDKLQDNNNVQIIYAFPGEFIDYLCQILTEREYYIIDNNIEFKITKSNRNEKGVFFTPYFIANKIFNLSYKKFKNKKRINSILDPACGSCVFLSAASHILVKEGYSRKNIIKILFGFDINDFYYKVGFLLVQLELKTNLEEALINNPNNFKKLDFLSLRLKTKNIQHELFSFDQKTNIKTHYDIVIMNPPYDRLKPDKLNSDKKKLAKKTISDFRSSKYFELTNTGSLDYYRFFIEQTLNLLSENSTLSAIVPKSLVGDLNNKKLREYLINFNLLDSLILISEKDKIFKNVNQSFVIFLITKSKKREYINIENYNQNKSKNKIALSFIQEKFASSFIIPNIDKEGINLLSIIDSNKKIRNIDFIANHRGEIDLTLDRDVYESGSTPFYRGKDINLYKSNLNSYACIKKLKKKKPSKYFDVQNERIVGQQISNMDSKQRLKFAIIKKGCLIGNSLNYLIVRKNKYNISSHVILAILNSLLLDWRFRITSTNNHINNYELDDLPINILINKKIIDKLNFYVKKIQIKYNEKLRKEIELNVLKIFKAEKYKKYIEKNHPNGTLLK